MYFEDFSMVVKTVNRKQNSYFFMKTKPKKISISRCNPPVLNILIMMRTEKMNVLVLVFFSLKNRICFNSNLLN